MNNNIENAKHLAKDLIQGDESVANREDFNSLQDSEVREAISLIINNPSLSENDKKDLLLNTWKIHYKHKPPTIEEFLTADWIGPTSLHIYDHVKKILGEFWHPTSPYRHLLLSGHIGQGKSFMSTLCCLYTAVHIWSLRDSKKFFNINVASPIVQALVSFNLEKVKQVLLQPFFQILITSPKFLRVRREDKLLEAQTENPEKIVFTSAGRVGEIQFTNDIHLVIASNPAHLLGLSLITAILSELSFFLDRGISPETIWRIYQDSKNRIYSRFGNRYFATSIIDSSPNDMELSPIDKYVFSGEANKDPLNYVVTGKHWETFPEKHPIYFKTGKTFPVFRGSGSKPPKILELESDVEKYTKEEIHNVPIDLKQAYKDDLVKMVKDYGGWPSGSQSKIIDDFSIIEKMFSEQLNNEYTYIYAPSDELPEGLIWNQIKDKFFVETSPGHYEFYRSPKEARYIHIDQSESGDMASITMVHPEVSKKGDIIQVTDFTIVINPNKKKKKRINLDAIYCFIVDLRKKGNILLKRTKKIDKLGRKKITDIGKITFDQFQSSASIQRLDRNGFPVQKLSVDRDINVYITFVSWLSNGRVKCGKNIILKNNLKSLIEVRTEKGHRKVDHLQGTITVDDGGDWKTSQMGINAKDCSDTLCGAVWNSIQHYEGIPRYQWYNDNEIATNKKDSAIKNKILEEINNKFGLTTV